jgi:hypothetical protein
MRKGGMVCGAYNRRGIPVVDFEGRESLSEINRIASEFLKEWMQNHGSVEFHKVVCPHKQDDIVDSHETATNFLMQHLRAQATDSVESDRIEVTEPESVVLLRVCPRPLPAFYAGTLRGKLIWTYDARLAKVFERDEGQEFVKTLEGIQVFFLPATGERGLNNAR